MGIRMLGLQKSTMCNSCIITPYFSTLLYCSFLSVCSINGTKFLPLMQNLMESLLIFPKVGTFKTKRIKLCGLICAWMVDFCMPSYMCD